jgi:hypothetical protein
VLPSREIRNEAKFLIKREKNMEELNNLSQEVRDKLIQEYGSLEYVFYAVAFVALMKLELRIKQPRNWSKKIKEVEKLEDIFLFPIEKFLNDLKLDGEKILTDIEKPYKYLLDCYDNEVVLNIVQKQDEELKKLYGCSFDEMRKKLELI